MHVARVGGMRRRCIVSLPLRKDNGIVAVDAD